MLKLLEKKLETLTKKKFIRELNTGTDRYTTFVENLPGIHIDVMERTLDKLSSIQTLRNYLKTMWIDPKCVYLIKCLYNYSKEWDDKGNCWKHRKPKHDEWSNGADSLMYFAEGHTPYYGRVRAKVKNMGYAV